MISIRSANYEDMDSLVELCSEYHATMHHSDMLPSDKESIRSVLSLAQTSVTIAETDGKIVGVFIAILSPYQWNHSVTVAHELAWYVVPEYRKRAIGLSLKRAAEAKLKDLGATITINGVIYHPACEQAIQLYPKLKHLPFGVTFIKEL